MKEVLTEMIDNHRRILNELAARLREFAPYKEQNEAARSIYREWFNGYRDAALLYKDFEQIAKLIQAGQLDEAKAGLGLPDHILKNTTSQIRSDILTMILINEKFPYLSFAKIMQVANRTLISSLIMLSADPQNAEDIALLGSWISTFPHIQKESTSEDKPFFGGIVETGIKIAIGYAIGKST